MSEKAEPKTLKVPEWFKKSVAKFYDKEIKEQKLIGLDEFAEWLWHIFTKELNKIFFEGLVKELKKVVYSFPLREDSHGSDFEIYRTTDIDKFKRRFEKLLARLGVKEKQP